MSFVEYKKPWPIHAFETFRDHLVNFLKTYLLVLLDSAVCRRIVIRAPVKSGKRDMVEYIALRDRTTNPRRVHAFVTAWVRIADKDQLVELADHNVTPFTIINDAHVKKLEKWINEQLAASREVVIHLDECDYGTGEKQKLSKVWAKVRENDHITTILYSATPEEVCCSGEVDDADTIAMHDEFMEEGVTLRYTPPPEYCGPAAFLDRGIVFDARPFFEMVNGTPRLSAQGQEIVNDLRASMLINPKRNIIVLRLSAQDEGGSRTHRKEHKHFHTFLDNRHKIPELDDFVVYADKPHTTHSKPRIVFRNIDWSNEEEWEGIASDKPIMIVIDQTSSRSTEWKCHHRIFATHDFRHNGTYSVLSQAQERVNHYIGIGKRYTEFQPIRVYGLRKVFELSAGRIGYMDFLKTTWVAHKIDHRATNGETLYKIVNSDTRAQHPDYMDRRLTKQESDNALLDLGSYVDLSISARVAASQRSITVADTTFIPCAPDAFDAVGKAEINRILRTTPRILTEDLRNELLAHRFMNPFDERQKDDAGRYKGSLRGYRVFTYDEVHANGAAGVKSSPRLTVCYNDGVLGFALRWRTGEIKHVTRMDSYKSMYMSRGAE